ncbi:3-dehydroquinate synthase [Enterococcus sulfureus ATCC 49903]|uniref:3-dehydroquinate synthase n=1 Tax=Enterococcus sulfureus ATCC 49903 TaxID=1140003 RepID=S0P675_9ENTE|nr:3-dehydroquinate synthase [Enterococcus sulfureus]EOT47653.1 3-dehydroquinate synthase [Enterococcus sulfureus ATCC 49903]EOT83926.1 3-dehydroquinate synthase [Enterococcus sulfureus ATCC 49903]
MLTVQTKDHSYNIQIKRQSLSTIGDFLTEIWQPKQVAIITDTRVGELYAETVFTSLQNAGFTPTVLTVPEGEESKSFTQAMKLYEKLAQANFTRSDAVLALGGGVIGDLAGFVASTYMRGIGFSQVPTSLLAQVDSSIGGKTAVNTPTAKNLVGSFYQPDAVLIDPDVLDTLEPRRLREGIAEIVKAAAIADVNLWEELTQYQDEFDLLNHVESVILKALKVKQAVVEEDEFDNGIRLILNFGHTIGHAIEKNAGYGKISHGEAVSLGMVWMSKAASEHELMSASHLAPLRALLEKFHLPTTIPNDLERTHLFDAITKDKKARGHTLQIIVLEEIGKARIETIPVNMMEEFLQTEGI